MLSMKIIVEIRVAILFCLWDTLIQNIHIVSTKAAMRFVMLFVLRPTDRTNMEQSFFRWVQAQGCRPDTLGEHKNASGIVGIL